MRPRSRDVGWRRGEPADDPTPGVLAVAIRPPVRSEKAEEQLCDDLIARLGGREGVVRFSQARATRQTLGISDRRYRWRVAFWWEVKAAGGKLRAEQVDFLEAELAHGQLVGVGTLEDLLQYVGTIRDEPYPLRRHDLLVARGRALIDRYRPKAKKATRSKLNPLAKAPRSR